MSFNMVYNYIYIIDIKYLSDLSEKAKKAILIKLMHKMLRHFCLTIFFYLLKFVSF